jgi:hypothetical protein
LKCRTFVFRLDETNIIGNGFMGNFTSSDTGGGLSDASYDGRFFGKDAPQAGGQISATITVEGADQPTFIEAAFLATR